MVISSLALVTSIGDFFGSVCILGAMGTQLLKNKTQLLKNRAQLLKNTAQLLKNMAQLLKNTGQLLKNTAQIFNNWVKFVIQRPSHGHLRVAIRDRFGVFGSPGARKRRLGGASRVQFAR